MSLLTHEWAVLRKSKKTGRCCLVEVTPKQTQKRAKPTTFSRHAQAQPASAQTSRFPDDQTKRFPATTARLLRDLFALYE